jgi:hypothetical protein
MNEKLYLIDNCPILSSEKIENCEEITSLSQLPREFYFVAPKGSIKSCFEILTNSIQLNIKTDHRIVDLLALAFNHPTQEEKEYLFKKFGGTALEQPLRERNLI